jgi:hypothetical protein
MTAPTAATNGVDLAAVGRLAEQMLAGDLERIAHFARHGSRH